MRFRLSPAPGARPDLRLAPRLVFVLLATLPLIGGGCGGGGDGPRSAAPPILDAEAIAPGSREVQREIRDLVTALTPPPASASTVEKSDWFPRRARILERLRSAGPEVAWEALRVYLGRPEALEKVRVGLLDVAAHGLPDETRPLLVALITTFSEFPELRTAACDILARTSPATAAELLSSILREERPRLTYPPLDKILDAWLIATETTGDDRTELLAALATDLRKQTGVRTAALRALGEHESLVGRQALETVLVESSGNHYLRRVAVQSLLSTLPRPEFCALLRDVAANEVDTQFQVFLADNLDKYCQ